MIRTSAHTLKYANNGKRANIARFLFEYRRLFQYIIDDIWENGIMDLDIPNNKLSCPLFLPGDYVRGLESWFTFRMRQCVGKQACAMIKAATKKRSQQLYKLRELQRDGNDTRKLQSKIDRQPLVKPNASRANAVLDSRFVNFQNGNKFDLFVRIITIGNNIVLKLPIKHTKISRKWLSLGVLKKSITLSEDKIVLFYDIENTPIKKTGRIVGCDQGYKTVASLSDGQATQPNAHGHSLETIQAVLARRKRGSNGFKRAQEHRENYINWSLNQLNWSGIKQVRLEKIKQLRYKNRTSRLMRGWRYTLIKQKLVSLGETEGFRITEVPNAFRSQRCYNCGWVRKANRKGKTFKCNRCNYIADADMNAASNLALSLYEIPNWVRQQRINRNGFYWGPDGLYTTSHERIVRDTQRAEE